MLATKSLADVVLEGESVTYRKPTVNPEAKIIGNLKLASFFQNEEIVVELDELDELDRITHA